jgi:hypothetical protein
MRHIMSDQRQLDTTRISACPEFRTRSRNRFELNCEALECRQLLSTTASTISSLSELRAFYNLQASPMAAPGPTGLTPASIQNAYGFNQIADKGTGQTIAIITAFNDPKIQADLAAFDKQFGLSAPPSFTISNMGATTTDPGWSLETALDVEWAHAIAPGANILLVEASSDTGLALFNAVSHAKQAGASVVSMSWGIPEFAGEQSLDSYFTSSGTTGVTFIAASGDAGAWFGPTYPSVSPNVLAVGGTSLALSPTGGYGSEASWSGSTGGFSGLDTYWSSYEPEPAYQTSTLQKVGLSYGVRTTPDVSFNADPNTGVPVYDTVPYNGRSGWFQVGGTSAAAPAWAGLIAIADQALHLAGHGPLSGTQAMQDLYNLPSSYFHDITSGYNGYFATHGYDLVTGLGTPNANLVVAGLVSLGVSQTPTLVRASAATATTTNTAGATASQLDLTVSQTGGTASSGGSSATAGSTGAGSILSLASSLSGASPLASSTSIFAFAPQTPITQAQPVLTQAAPVHIEQAVSASTTPGQSLIQNSDVPSRNTEISRPSEPNGFVDETPVSPAPASLPVEDAAPPAPEPPEAPLPEAPSPAQEAEPAPPVDLPSVSMESFDLALAQLNMSYEEDRVNSPAAPWAANDGSPDASTSGKASAPAGAAAIAAAGYWLVHGRSDRNLRQWTRRQFE